MEFNKLLGRRLKEIRKSKKFSQEKLAEKANISSKYLGEIERGNVNVSFVVLNDLVNALNVSIADLMQNSHSKKPEELRKEITHYTQKASDEEIVKIYMFIKYILNQ